MVEMATMKELHRNPNYDVSVTDLTGEVAFLNNSALRCTQITYPEQLRKMVHGLFLWDCRRGSGLQRPLDIVLISAVMTKKVREFAVSWKITRHRTLTKYKQTVKAGW